MAKGEKAKEGNVLCSVCGNEVVARAKALEMEKAAVEKGEPLKYTPAYVFVERNGKPVCNYCAHQQYYPGFTFKKPRE